MAVPAKLLGNNPSLIHAGGSPSAEIELLQPYDIHRRLGDYFGYARFRTPPIHSHAAMYIVGCYAKRRFVRCSVCHVRVLSPILHLRPEDRHGSTLDLFLPRSMSPTLKRNFLRMALVLLKNFCVQGDEFPVEDVEVRLFVQ
jgi:hypothetical protein